VQFGLAEPAVVALMRRELKRASFKRWRERMKGRTTKHTALRPVEMNDAGRHRAKYQSASR